MATDKNGCTPLHYAAGNGQSQVVKKLISFKAPFNVKNEESQTTLIAGVCSGSDKVVQKLILAGAENVPDKLSRTPLCVAAYKGHYKVLRTLIKSGANIHCVSKEGRTPLHYAALGGNARVVKELISYGADIDEKDKNKSPLICSEERSP